MTPRPLAEAIVAALKPSGRVLEPCAGDGAFVEALRRAPGVTEVLACEIADGSDFLTWTGQAAWIITNPPWSQYAAFLAHSLKLADHVGLVSSLNHIWTRSRRRMVREAGFGLARILEFPAPPEWQATGFALGCALFERGYTGPCFIEPLEPTRPVTPDSPIGTPR